jgi:hypothetical protein
VSARAPVAQWIEQRFDTTKRRFEPLADRHRAYVMRAVARKHYRAATMIARFPETHVAVRDAIDNAALKADAPEPDLGSAS